MKVEEAGALTVELGSSGGWAVGMQSTGWTADSGKCLST